jgi:membrane protein
VKDRSPESPEARKEHPGAHPRGTGWQRWIGPGSRPFEIGRRIVVGVYYEGFIHAGNLAYLTLLTLFPFFIVTTAVAEFFGRTQANIEAIKALLATLPPSVAAMVEATAMDVISTRSGPVLWLGAGIGLWTVTSFIETIREILRRAYGADYGRPFWHYRLAGIGIIVGAVTLIMFAFSATVFITATEEVIYRYLPAAQTVFDDNLSRFWPIVMMFAGLLLIFWALSPSAYRGLGFPVWPGALFVTAWWYGAVTLLPRVLDLFGGYALTYGSLAGVMVALLFFWLVGYGLVIGAHINAALANPDRTGLKGSPVLDDLVEAKWLDT